MTGALADRLSGSTEHEDGCDDVLPLHIPYATAQRLRTKESFGELKSQASILLMITEGQEAHMEVA